MDSAGSLQRKSDDTVSSKHQCPIETGKFRKDKTLCYKHKLIYASHEHRSGS